VRIVEADWASYGIRLSAMLPTEPDFHVLMPLVKIHRKGQMTLPTGVRAAMGLADGDLVDVRISGRRIIVTPKSSHADDDDSPEQRRLVEAQLAEGLEDIRKGRVSKKFDTVDEMLVSLKSDLKTAPRRQIKPRS